MRESESVGTEHRSILQDMARAGMAFAEAALSTFADGWAYKFEGRDSRSLKAIEAVGRCSLIARDLTERTLVDASSCSTLQGSILAEQLLKETLLPCGVAHDPLLSSCC